VCVLSDENKTLVNVHIPVDGNQSLEEAHTLTETIKKVIEGFLPEAEVLIHPELCLITQTN
jgi:divalent metal cation (Fe/Co/Zn/Cd) transporter